MSPWLLAAALAVGVASRTAYYLADLSYWYDEAFLVLPVIERPAVALLGPLPTRVITPPLFLWLLRGAFVLGGPAEWVMRLPAFVAGLLALVAVAMASVRLLGRPGGYWAAVLAALSPHALMHGAEVRPYSSDLLATALVLFAAATYLNPRGRRDHRLGGGGLLVLGAALPWLSFTSAFVLAGAWLALAADAVWRGVRQRWIFLAVLSALEFASFGGVWYVQARHMYYPGLAEHWRAGWDGLPADYRPVVLVGWTVRRFIGLADYPSTGLGLPLVALGIWGARSLARRSVALAILPVTPVLVAYVAAVAGRYPLGDRTVFFLAPCVWCLACAGLADIWQRQKARGHCLAFGLVLASLFGVVLVKSTKDAWRPVARQEYREALDFLRQHRGPGEDAVVWCRPLHDVYLKYLAATPTGEAYDEATPAPMVAARTRTRLWVVAPDGPVEPMVARLTSLGLREQERRRFIGVAAVRLEPAVGARSGRADSGAGR